MYNCNNQNKEFCFSFFVRSDSVQIMPRPQIVQINYACAVAEYIVFSIVFRQNIDQYYYNFPPEINGWMRNFFYLPVTLKSIG